MSCHRVFAAAAMLVDALASADEGFCEGLLYASASCVDSSHISFHWTFWEDPRPIGPEWVGYDVLRRSVAECGPLLRVNDDPFPHVPGAGDSYTYTEVPPTPRTTYEYQVVFVDTKHQQVSRPPLSCDIPCIDRDWASCPQYSAPLTEGTLEDWGWALFVHACACFQSRGYPLDSGWQAVPSSEP